MSEPHDPIVRGELSGLPFFAKPEPGPLVGALLFRVGRSDEPVTKMGITHLVEHLLMPPSTSLAVDANGTVDGLYTSIWASGDEHDVRQFLEGVVARVHALPVERLDVERRILGAEEELTSWSAPRQAVALRFGPNAHGLVGYGELGLRGVTQEDALRWVAERYTAGNAVLWATDPGFSATLELPPGEARPALEPRPIPYVELPSLYPAGPGGNVLLSVLGARTIAFSLGFGILERRLQNRLRFELGYSYAINADRQALTGSVSHSWIGGDVADDAAAHWCAEALEIFDALATDGPTSEELEQQIGVIRRAERAPGFWHSMLDWTAERHLLGLPYESHADTVREEEDATPEQVAATLRAARETLLVVTSGAVTELPGVAPYPLASPTRVSGRRHRPFALTDRRRGRNRHLSVSPEGITVEWPDRTVITARYDSTVLVLRDGDNRTLLTDDGFFLPIDPTDWTRGKRIVEELDAAIPAERVVSDDPVRDMQVDNVALLAQSTFKRAWLVSDELKHLPLLLEEDEKLLALGAGSRGWRYGLLALTDRRFHFLYGEGSKHSFSVERRRLPAKVDGSTLEIFVDDEWIAFTDVGPKGKAEELEQLLHHWGLAATT